METMAVLVDAAGKPTGVSVGSKHVAGDNISGTVVDIQFHCSQSVFNEWKNYVTHGSMNADDVDFELSGFFCAKLWLDKYEQTSSWSMDSTEEWDAAVLAQLAQFKLSFPQ